ncbi:unnamed protein product [Linum trigynum]|uniref:Uncharacterized protein n=1 Tax=Linum trigynum TaxID=586398 RepID=A0AAV2GC22_9ROSI
METINDWGSRTSIGDLISIYTQTKRVGKKSSETYAATRYSLPAPASFDEPVSLPPIPPAPPPLGTLPPRLSWIWILMPQSLTNPATASLLVDKMGRFEEELEIADENHLGQSWGF